MSTKTALTGAASGAAMGATLGPVGAGVGALAGGLAGLFSKDPAPTGGGGGVPLGMGGAPTDQDTNINIENNLVGAPININIGGQQQADGSLGAGQRYNDRGVDTPGVNAPFGTMQDVAGTYQTNSVAWNDIFQTGPQPGSSNKIFWIVGGVLVVAGAGLALVKRRHS